MTSLRTELWIGMLSLLTSVGLVAAGFSYWNAGEEARGFFDQQLRLIALNVDVHGRDFTANIGDAPPHDPEDDFVVQVWDQTGTPLRTMAPGPDIPKGGVTGFRDALIGSTMWRSYTLIRRRHTVQVSQQNDVREEMASEAAWRSLLPIAVTIPLSWLVLSLVINRALGRLDDLAQALSRRRALDRSPIPTEGVAKEVEPLVAAVNEALTAQGRFISDAAHALRTPLAALQLQVGNLRKVTHSEEATRRIDELERGVKRAIELVRQLLRLARSHDRGLRSQVGQVDLCDHVRASIATLLPLSDDRGQDVGLVRCDPGVVFIDAEDLRVLIDNLLENAIRYTPLRGTIDISVAAGDHVMTFEVRDTGPGIPEDLLELAFEPFHRVGNLHVEGSGLGLSIIAGIAEQYGATINIANRTDRSGLIARVNFKCHLPVTDPSFAPQSRALASMGKS
jgi:two-component system OmpR family sensor kinase